MPGHYVQGEFANDVQPKTRRVLRALFGNGPYVEGWAQYVTQVMLDEGFLDNSPELRLTLLKQELRVDANAIIDIRMQTNRMTDEEAMDLMENSTFQEHEEAVAKLQRVKLSSTQLPTYFVGWRDWLQGSGTGQEDERRIVSGWRISTIGRLKKERFRCRCWRGCLRERDSERFCGSGIGHPRYNFKRTAFLR